jgi:predicted lipid carrier protein YhbT
MAAQVELLTQDWLDAQREATQQLPERPGASATIEYRVSGGPDGEVVFHTVLTDGRITWNALGPAESDADFTVLVAHAEYVAIVRGELDQNVGFMQGRVKVTGNIGRMLSVLPVTTSAEWRAAADEVLARTAF